MIRQGVILAAGKGRRMVDGSGNITPKPLMQIKGEAMIKGKVRDLAANGIETCIVVNPASEVLFRKELADYDAKYCHQDVPRGTGDALYCSKGFVKDNLFIVMMGDDIAEYNIGAMARIDEPTVFGYKVDDVSGFGALIVEGGEVLDVIEKEMSGKGIVNTGVYVMPRSFFEHYKELEEDKNGEMSIPAMIAILRSHGIRFRLGILDRWVGINTRSELLSANFDSIF